jgi:hypothetical protein
MPTGGFLRLRQLRAGTCRHAAALANNDLLLDLGTGIHTAAAQFNLWAEGEGQLERFAEQVVPAVRAQAAAERV